MLRTDLPSDTVLLVLVSVHLDQADPKSIGADLFEVSKGPASLDSAQDLTVANPLRLLMQPLRVAFVAPKQEPMWCFCICTIGPKISISLASWLTGPPEYERQTEMQR